jgi:hypothetical protein
MAVAAVYGGVSYVVVVRLGHAGSARVDGVGYTMVARLGREGCS